MKQRILIIEDDNFIASLMVETFNRAGFDVDLAIDGEKGLKKLEKQIPDIIFLDLILPGISGFELLEKFKKEDKTKKIPIVIISNLGSRDEIQKGLKLGASAYLIKAHILTEELVKKAKEVLRKKNLKGRSSNK